jgi:Arc/MetJ family transcription regulator
MHRTTVEIDEELLSKAMKISGAKTKKKVIEISLKEFIKSRNRASYRNKNTARIQQIKNEARFSS